MEGMQECKLCGMQGAAWQQKPFFKVRGEPTVDKCEKSGLVPTVELTAHDRGACEIIYVTSLRVGFK
ncbi:MAG: hypothetical protein L7F78_20570, partial [Syntrophales bacterium LBB04]|nr:hypothetical protein [Syntrophales bacterium LBB04]